MSKAQICPICMGKGKIMDYQGQYVAVSDKYIICHGCGGKGWVTIRD